jgi:hypothetical protein
VRSTLEAIAEDETRHAALAWRTLEWALEQGGAAAASALREAAGGLRPGEPPALPASEPALRRHGRSDLRMREQARADAWRDIIEPTLDRLLAGSPAAVS